MTPKPDLPDPLWRIWRIGWWGMAVAIFLQGAWDRFRLPQWPVIVPDSYIYLIPTVNGGAYGIGPRMFLYPMFCRTAVRLAHDWRGIVVIQHILGLLGPALLLLAWVALGKSIWRSRLARAAHEAAGLALVLLLVPSGIYIAYEQQVLLEAPNTFLQCSLAAALCGLWLPLRSGRRLALACGTAGLGIFMYYANPRWGAAAPVVLLFAAAAAAMVPGRRYRAGGVVLAVGAATFWGFGCLQSRIVPRDPWDDTFTATHLLWMHADLALNEFRRDLAAPIPPPQAALLRKIIPKIEKEIVGYDVSYWHTLTFNPNALLYVADNPNADLIAAFRNDPEGYKRFCLHYYFRIIWHQPGAYFKKVRRILGWYYATPPLRDGAFREVGSPVTALLLGGAPIARELAQAALPPERAQLEAAAQAMAAGLTPPAGYFAPSWLSAVVEIARVWFLPATLAGAICALSALGWSRRGRCPGLAAFAWICVASISILFAQVLTLAMVTITEGRYSDALRTLAVFSLVCSIIMVGSMAFALGTALRNALKKAPILPVPASRPKSLPGLDSASGPTQS